MSSRVFAAADIGSNTAHLLVAATDGSLVMRIDNYNEWIPLGEVVTRVGSIPKEVTQDLVDACKSFKRLADAKGAEELYVFATEGMRMARNHETVLRKIQEESQANLAAKDKRIMELEYSCKNQARCMNYIDAENETRKLENKKLFEELQALQ